MKYIIFDLEFNSPFKINRKTNQLMRGDTNPLCPQEIIEIGAVKTNNEIQIEDTFKLFVRPQLYPKLHPKVKKKTKITKEDLQDGLPFQEAIKAFKEWIEEDDFIMASWGIDDINELKRNCDFFNIKTPWITKICDVQKECMNYLDIPTGRQIGLKNAVETFHIDINYKFHKALNDAIYTAEIFKKLKNNKII
ncbi:3'-5' exonuclease [Natronincola ferrireducens]|uniref:Inhibitor of the KinA pathway to sporulation, predicted exonuclease n=1 Tax=Natronincola ferrireducens TaxID=393762 RepID=A0A1G9ADN2_9FIRM|nr:3'-5' exonuclease [Natronincola ferrireducens]SDK24635.1 Inhibitor of the KinA pathway to sporulation, predicted exonuclease [Natronincola ferrireducens]